MSCCSDQRGSLRVERPVDVDRRTSHWSPGPTAFLFNGPGQLVVRGPLTGTEYRFASGGPSVQVHPADVASLAGVPGLTVVR